MGNHYLLNICGVEALLLMDMEGFIEFIRPTLEDNMADIVGETHHRFPGSTAGYTSLFLLASSHFSIHTWPEKNCAAIDMFSCGDIAADNVVKYVVQFFSPAEYDLRMIKR